MKFARKISTLLAVALISLLSAAIPARAQSVITTIAGGGTIPNPPLANICLPVTAMTMYGGNIYFASCNQVWKETLQGQLTLIAGSGAAGFGGDGSLAINALLNSPNSLGVDPNGNVFISDGQNARIREVVAATGTIQTLAGNGSSGNSGDGGPAINAGFAFPEGIAVDSSDDVFVSCGPVVREITATNGTIQTIAGGGSISSFINGFPAKSVALLAPYGLFLDGQGSLYIGDLARVYKMSLSAATLAIIAGTGTPGPSFTILQPSLPATGIQINNPQGVTADSAGNVYIADTANGCVQAVIAATGTIQFIFGNGTDGISTNASTAALNTPLLNPRGISVDGSGDIFVSDNRGIWESIASTGNALLLAGSSNAGYSVDGVVATKGTLFFPQNVAVDSSGNLLIADTMNLRLREIRAADGTIQTLAGNGMAYVIGMGTSVEPSGIGFGAGQDLIYMTQHPLADGSSQYAYQDELLSVSPSNGAVTTLVPATYLWDPNGVSIDSNGNIILADTLHNVIERMVPGGISIQTLAGIGFLNTISGGGLGDGGPATSAFLGHPLGVFVDASGNVFIADTLNNRIREILASNGNIQTVAGSSTSVGFGGDGGPATNAQLADPDGVAVDGSGNIYVADTVNNRVREVVAATGNIQTIAGTGVPGFGGDNGPAINAQLDRPTGLAFDLQGNLLIVDTYNSRIRKLVMAAPAVTVSSSTLSFTAQTPATTSGAMSITLTNTGNETLSISAAPAISGTNSGEFTIATGTTCTNGAMLAPAATCVVNVTFTPGAAGNRSATLTILNNATNSSTISLTGIGSDFSVGAQSGGATSATVTAGQTATYNLQLAPTGFTGTVNLTCSGAPAAATCTVSPTSLTLSGNSASTFTVSVTTTARSGLMMRPSAPNNLRLFAITLCFGAFASLALLTLRKRHRLAFAFLAVAFVGLAAAGCGGGGSSTYTGGTTGTPAGASTLTINATSGSVTHSIQLTLNVN